MDNRERVGSRSRGAKVNDIIGISPYLRMTACLAKAKQGHKQLCKLLICQGVIVVIIGRLCCLLVNSRFFRVSSVSIFFCQPRDGRLTNDFSHRQVSFLSSLLSSLLYHGRYNRGYFQMLPFVEVALHPSKI